MALLDGKVASSGAGPGLGATSPWRAAAGATVVVAARTEEQVRALAAEVEAAGAPALACGSTSPTPSVPGRGRADRRRLGPPRRAGEQRLRRRRPHPVPRRRPRPLAADHQVNLFGTLQLTQACAPQMGGQGAGHRDGPSMSAVRIRPGWGAYTASKAGLAAVTKILAAELGEHGVRVNRVDPGYIWGDSVECTSSTWPRRRASAPTSSTAWRPRPARVPAALERDRRVGVFFASDMSKPITGQALGVNAGQWFQGF